MRGGLSRLAASCGPSYSHASGARAPQDFNASVNATYASWLLNQWIFDHPLPPIGYARALAGSRQLRYEFYVAAVSLPSVMAIYLSRRRTRIGRAITRADVGLDRKGSVATVGTTS
jgi:hypothetical protein